jgi:transaldolase
MKIFLASVDVDDIRWASSSGLLDGVVTSPSLVAKSGARLERDLLADICRAAAAPVFVNVRAVDTESIYREGKEIARLSDHIVVQVPLVEDAMGAIRRLCMDGVRVAAILVFNGAQGLLAAKAGAASVITPVDQLDAVGHSGVHVIRELRSVFDAARTECDIIAVRPRTATQLSECVLAGADGVAVTADVLRNLLVHPLTDRGLDQLLNDLSKQRATWADA